MNNIKAQPLEQWLDKNRPAETLVARQGTQQYRLGEMRQQVIALCQQLMAAPQQRWALCFDNSYYFTVALLALLHSAKTAVIPGHGRESLLREQRNLFDGLLTDMPLALDCPVLTVDRDMAMATDRATLPPLPASAAVVLFTSGSTGQPREIIKSVASLDREIALLAGLWGERLAGCHVLSSVTHQHLYGLTFRIMLPMALGLSFASDLTKFSEQFASQRAPMRYAFISSPAFLRRLDTRLPPPPCTLVLSAGGPLPWLSARQVERWLGVIPNEIYGSTETGVLAWRTCISDKDPWQPFAGVYFSTDSDDSNNNDEDKIWRVHSPLIAGNVRLTLDDRLDFSPGEGRFHLCGRRDRMVKIEERRLSLSEIERRLQTLNGVAEAVAIPVSRGGRVHIGAVLVLDASGISALNASNRTLLTRHWCQGLRQWLEPVAIPRYWRIVENIPVNSQSKRAYSQLQALFHAAS